MTAKVYDRKLSDVEMRHTYIQTLIDMAKVDSKVVNLDADLRSALNFGFAEAFPDRAIECGVQEANMVGLAAGMSAVGIKPFIQSFTPFIVRRPYEVIAVTAAYGKLNLKIMGFDQGVLAAYNGGTHMSFDDISLIRNIPEAMIFDVADPVMLQDLMWQIKDIYGVQYLRFSRDKVKQIYSPGTKFNIGKGVVLRRGKDATIITSGIQVDEALTAAEILASEGIEVTVVDMFTHKPIDRELVCECAHKTGCIVTAENHSIINGLGSAVADVVVEKCLVPMERVGVKDLFGEVGPVDYLMKRFELTAETIIKKTKKAIARKNQ